MPIVPRLFWPALAVATLLLSGCSDSSDPANESAADNTEYPQTWRFALEEIEGSVQHAFAQAFSERIKEVSNGDIEVDIFPYGSLGTSTQLTELTRNGSVNLAFASPGHLADQVPETGLFNLHFVLPEDDAQTRRLLQSPALLAAFDQPYRDAGLHLLALVSEGWMAWTANQPLRSPADFTGLRIRTMTANMAAEAYRAYGAQPVQTPYSRVYSDLQLHNIHGQANPVFAIEEMGFHEVQSTLTLPRASRFISSVIANPDWVQSLDEREREWLATSIRDLANQAREIEAELNRERLEQMVERGDLEVVRLSDAEREAFRRASLPSRELYIEQTGERGQALLEMVLASEPAVDTSQ
ncbi:MAG: TRAP transporter substrate-binding protein DctP [Alteromonadaceae bacterium]|nr:TRAP transporter substrate-binding protein DctP [Alteromonadaceae bacterium]